MINYQHTRVAAIVHSHNSNEPIDLSLDLIRFSCNKTVKSAGTATLTLVPRKNYLNLIFPDDVIDVYVDPGDGKRGFVRTFFGYIDRVDVNFSINKESGATTTNYQVHCTDFTKAIEKTNIYFNPQVAGRSDFVLDSRFSKNNINGHSLRTRGVVATGTPADMMENLLYLLLGFGSQWVLPTSYPTTDILANRQERLQRAVNKIPPSVKELLRKFAGLQDSDLNKISVDQFESAIKKAQELIKQQTLTKNLGLPDHEKARKLADTLAGNSELLAYRSILSDLSSGLDASILDILNLSFIEAMATDGYNSATTVWDAQGTLNSIMYNFSNEIVNELFFDLRPIAKGGDPAFGTINPPIVPTSTAFTGELPTVTIYAPPSYSKEPDLLRINTDGTKDYASKFPASVAADKYEPAVIFREYPYSTISKVDLTGIDVMGADAGPQFMGPVFKVGLNEPGRHVYDYTKEKDFFSIRPEPCLFDTNAKPLKHIDSYTILTTDVINGNVGRSDKDTFNLFEMYNTSLSQKVWKYIGQDFMPLVTPVSIARHGLRTRTHSTKFANYSRDILCRGDATRPKETLGPDSPRVRRNLIRWILLIDHWYQHNIEFLSGTITLRAFPDIRVGYRLDWEDRNESYYVDSVSHNWEYPNEFTTTLNISRGVANNPFPAYIPPMLGAVFTTNVAKSKVSTDRTDLKGRKVSVLSSQETLKDAGGGNRQLDGRLAEFFKVKSPSAVIKESLADELENTTDKPENVNGFAIFPSKDQ